MHRSLCHLDLVTACLLCLKMVLVMLSYLEGKIPRPLLLSYTIQALEPWPDIIL